MENKLKSYMSNVDEVVALFKQKVERIEKERDTVAAELATLKAQTGPVWVKASEFKTHKPVYRPYRKPAMEDEGEYDYGEIYATEDDGRIYLDVDNECNYEHQSDERWKDYEILDESPNPNAYQELIKERDELKDKYNNLTTFLQQKVNEYNDLANLIRNRIEEGKVNEDNVPVQHALASAYSAFAFMLKGAITPAKLTQANADRELRDQLAHKEFCIQQLQQLVEADKVHFAQMKEKGDKMADMLDEARFQIEYLHNKFQPTGSGNNVLSRIETALANWNKPGEGKEGNHE